MSKVQILVILLAIVFWAPCQSQTLSEVNLYTSTGCTGSSNVILAPDGCYYDYPSAMYIDVNCATGTVGAYNDNKCSNLNMSLVTGATTCGSAAPYGVPPSTS